MPTQLVQLLVVLLTATVVQQLHVPAAAATAAGAGAVDSAKTAQQEQISHSRKLLQPYTLKKPNEKANTTKELLPQSSSGKMNEKKLNDATDNVVAPEVFGIPQSRASLLDLDPLVANQITASAERSPRTGATNLLFGGVSKRTYQMTICTDSSSAITSTAGDVRAISQPGSGRTGGRVVERSASLSQKRLVPAAPVVNRSEAERPRFVGPEDDRELGVWEVLATAGVDYSFVGDYRAFTEGDYGRLAEPNSAVRVRNLRRGLPKGAYTEEELDYGQIDVLPASVIVTSRTAADLNDDAGRAAAFVRSSFTSQGPNIAARGNARSSALWGTVSARKNDDIFGREPVIAPAVPYTRSGAAHAASLRGTTYKGAQRPAIATRVGNAGTTLGRNGTTGGFADQLNYVAATRWSAARSQNLAIGSAVNTQFGVGRH